MYKARLLGLLCVDLKGTDGSALWHQQRSQQRKEKTPTLIVLSAPPVINLVPVWSNVEQNTPASASSEPGCGTSSMFWNGVPVL